MGINTTHTTTPTPIKEILPQLNVDLKRGNSLELYVKKLFEDKGCTVELSPNEYFPSHDLRVVSPRGTFNIEVKCDFYSLVSKNVAIEHQALQKTRSSHHVYIVQVPYLIKTADLEWLAYSPDFKQVPGGDDGRLQTLIPINSEAFREKFIKL